MSDTTDNKNIKDFKSPQRNLSQEFNKIILDTRTPEEKAAAKERNRKHMEITAARHAFERLSNLPLGEDIGKAERKIMSHLERAESDVSALDPTKKASTEEMEARLRHAVANVHIGRAQIMFRNLEGGADCIADIRHHLTSAKADMSVLDPDRKATKEEMEARFQTASRRIHIKRARLFFGYIEEASGSADISAQHQKIKESLRKADADASVLDPSGERTAEEMDEILKSAVANAHLRRADYLMKKFEVENEKEERTPHGVKPQDIWKELHWAGIDVSVDEYMKKKTEAEKIFFLKDAIKGLSAKLLRESQGVGWRGVDAPQRISFRPAGERPSIEEVRKKKMAKTAPDNRIPPDFNKSAPSSALSALASMQPKPPPKPPSPKK